MFICCVVCIHMYKHVHVCGCRAGWGQRLMLSAFINCSTLFFEPRFPTEPGAHCHWLGQQGPRIFLCLPPTPDSAGITDACLHAQLFCGCWWSEPSLHACLARTLLSHLPSLQNLIFLCQKEDGKYVGRKPVFQKPWYVLETAIQNRRKYELLCCIYMHFNTKPYNDH